MDGYIKKHIQNTLVVCSLGVAIVFCQILFTLCFLQGENRSCSNRHCNKNKWRLNNDHIGYNIYLQGVRFSIEGVFSNLPIIEETFSIWSIKIFLINKLKVYIFDVEWRDKAICDVNVEISEHKKSAKHKNTHVLHFKRADDNSMCALQHY